MTAILVVIIAFIVLETLNVSLLYFFPNSKKGNGIGVFNAYEKSKNDPEIHNLIKYLINWVAGTKIIFIALLAVILIFGSDLVQIASSIALVISITTFYWRLFPLLRKMDKNNELNPSGYSKTLAIMIGCFIFTFVLAIVYFKTTH